MRIRDCRTMLTTGLLSLCVVATLLSSLQAAEKTEKKERVRRPGTILRLSFDPEARQVGLFDGMEAGELDAWLIPENEFGGFVYVENKTDQPITVKLPKSAVAVANLKQFGQQQGGFGQQQGGFGQQGGQQGGQQNTGGGFGQQGGQQGGQFGGQQQGGQQGFFSIPPQRRVRLNFNSVCLNHGKRTPTKLNRYYLVDTDKYTNNETLKQVLEVVSNGQASPGACQAAAWYITDGLSFQQMAAKQRMTSMTVSQFFNGAELNQAQQILAYSHQKALEKQKQEAIETNTIPSSPVDYPTRSTFQQ